MSDLHNMSHPASAVGPTARAASGPTLVERAYEHLFSMLMSVKLAPGERIPLDTWARQLGNSHTPLYAAPITCVAEYQGTNHTTVGSRATQHASTRKSHTRVQGRGVSGVARLSIA